MSMREANTHYLVSAEPRTSHLWLLITYKVNWILKYCRNTLLLKAFQSVGQIGPQYFRNVATLLTCNKP